MNMDLNGKTNLITELAYLFNEWGDLLSEDESDLIKKVLQVAQIEGLEFIGPDVWNELTKIYRKYENKNLNECEYGDEEI